MPNVPEELSNALIATIQALGSEARRAVVLKVVCGKSEPGAKARREMPSRDDGGLNRLEGVIFIEVHVQGRNGVPGSVSAFDAYLGFRDMGFEVEVFDDPASLQGAPREDVVVGGVGVVRARLREPGADCPSINYPQELEAYLGAGFGAARSTR